VEFAWGLVAIVGAGVHKVASSLRAIALTGLLIVCAVLAACSSGGNGAPPATPPPAAVARIEVTPSAMLFTAASQTRKITVRAFDADNRQITGVAFTFSSSSAAASVAADGTVTSAAVPGSSSISVSSGSVTAPPVLVTIVQLRSPDSLLVSDTQVRTPPQLLSGAAGALGSRYTVTLSGVTAPAAGTPILASESAVLAGKVVSSASNASGGIDVVFEYVPLDELVGDLSISGSFSPAQLHALRRTANAGSAHAQAMGKTGSAVAAKPDCSLDFDPALLEIELTGTITDSLSFGFDVEKSGSEVQAFLLELKGTLSADITGSLDVFGATGTLSCIVNLGDIPIPITGWFAWFVSPVIPLDVKIEGELGASSNVSFGLSGDVTAEFTVGTKYSKAAGWTNISEGDVTPPQFDVAPAFPNTATRVSLDVFAGLRAGITIGNALGHLDNAVELAAGPEFDNTWGSPLDSSSDPIFASGYELKGVISAGPGDGLESLMEKLFGAVLSPDVSLSHELIIGQSPTLASARVSRAVFRAGDPLTFTVNLDPTTTRFPVGVGPYNVTEVHIYRIDRTGSSPRAEKIAAVAPNGEQMAFSIPWTASADGTSVQDGKPAFFAFLVPRIAGTLRSEFPVELGELPAPPIDVFAPQTQFLGGQQIRFVAYVNGVPASSGVTWHATGGSIDSTGLFTAGSQPGSYEITATIDQTGETWSTSVEVRPPPTFAVSAVVAGLTGAGLTLQNNAGDDLPVAANGTFAFATRLAPGAVYSVTVKTQPAGQSCIVSDGTGVVATADISVAVSCTTHALSLASSSPVNGANGVARTISPELTFSAPLDAATVIPANISWQSVGGIEPFTVSANGNRITITPGLKLLPLTNYTLTIRNAVRGAGGESLAGDVTLNFRTADGQWLASELVYTDELATPGEKQVAMDWNGNAVAVWESYGPDGFLVWGSYHSQNGWQHTEILSVDATAGQHPKVAMDRDGNALVVWYQTHNSRMSIASRRFVPATGWSEVMWLENDDVHEARRPQLAMAEDGAAFVAWLQSPDGVEEQVWASRYQAATGWSTPVLVSNVAGSTASPLVATRPGGDAVVVWERYESSITSRVWARRFSASTGWGTAEPIENHAATDVTPTGVFYDRDGNVLVTWFNSSAQWSSHFTPAGGWEPFVRASGDVGAVNDLGASTCAAGANTRAVIAWPSPDATQMWMSYYEEGNWSVPEEFQGNGDPLGDSISCAIDDSGNATVAWIERIGTEWNVWVRRRTRESGWAPAIQLETVDGLASEPALAVDLNGDLQAVWTQPFAGVDSLFSAPFR